MLLLLHFFKLDGGDAIWLTITNNQLSRIVSLLPLPHHQAILGYYQGGGLVVGVALTRSPVITQK